MPLFAYSHILWERVGMRRVWVIQWYPDKNLNNFYAFYLVDEHAAEFGLSLKNYFKEGCSFKGVSEIREGELLA